MTSRQGADRCPGLLHPFSAADGSLIRLRIPGGRVPVALLTELSAIAGTFGAPMIQLTSRGNLQLRGLPDPLPDELVARVESTGLLPSATHERVRNILAAPLDASLSPLVAELDEALRADPLLAQLPGRFLWVVTDASGALLGEPWDVAYLARTHTEGLVLAGDGAIEVDRTGAVPEMIRRARLFLDNRPDEKAWNVRDLPADSPVLADMHRYAVAATPPLRPGPRGADLVVGVPLGMLRPDHIEALAELGAVVVITPWRSLVVPGAAHAAPRLREVGLVISPQSPWARLSACVGAPHCRRTAVSTVDLTTAAAAQLTGDGPAVHVVGCERRCGEPAGEHVTVVAPSGRDDVLAAARSWE